MKILQITNYPSPYRVDFYNELGKQTELTVLFMEKPNTQKERHPDWFVDDYSHFRAVFLNRKIGFGKHAVCIDIFKYLRADFDLIVMGGYSAFTQMLAIEYMIRKQIPFCIEIDGGLIKQDSVLKEKIKRHYLSAASFWLSSGKVATEYLVHYGANADRIYEYPFTSMWEREISAFTSTKSEKQALRRELDMPEEKIILSIGNYIPRKGFDVLIRAAAELNRNTGIYIVGDGATKEYLKLCESMHIENVHFVGFKKKDKLDQYYRAADVFVLPTREDVWGLVVSEAMAHALPVVTTDRCVAGMELIHEGENGYIVPVEDEKALADAINKVLSKDISSMGESALKIIRPYTMENMVLRHMEIFDMVLKTAK